MKSARTGLWGVIFAALLVTGVALAQDIPFGEEKPAAAGLPAILMGRGPDRLAAEEVARQDAYRKLLERLYGTSLDGKTSVQDLTLASRTLQTSLENEIKGMREVATKYYEDGRVEIAVKVTMREVVEIIERTYKRVAENEKVVSEETLENVKRENRDQEITVVGRGALKDSKGLEKIRAMRAAEVDCYTRIAQRVFGLNVRADTTVRDFGLLSDAISSRVCVSLLNGVKFTHYDFLDDGTVAATGQITIREVVETLTRIYRRYGEGSKMKIEDIQNMETQYRDLVVSEVGKATVKAAATSTTEEVEVIMKKVLQKKVVTEQ